MTKLFPIILILTLFVNVAKADVLVVQRETPKKADFEEVLEAVGNWADNFDNPEFYGEIKRDKEKIKVSELPKIDQDVFFLLQGRILAVKLLKLNIFWRLYISDIREPKEDEATVSDVKEYIKKVTEIQKELAKSYKSLLEKVIEEHKIGDAEKKWLLEEVNQFNDTQGLVE